MTMTTEREAQVKMLISFFNVRSGCRYKFSKDANQLAMNNVIEAAGGDIHKVKAYFRENVQAGDDLIEFCEKFVEENSKPVVIEEVDPVGTVENTLNGSLDFLGKLVVEMLAKTQMEQVEAEVGKRLEANVQKFILDNYGPIQRKIELQFPERKVELEGVTHQMFDTVLQFVQADEPVFLTGPAGSGKNVLCQQVAKALGLNFYFSNAVTQEYKLTGFTDAMGVFHESQFYKAFKNGGVFMLDEMDASIPEVLIILNAAIANRYFDFPAPIGYVEAHPDFRVIAAGNTFGNGADYDYVGRNQLDAASLDRFAMVRIDYDERIEEACANGDADLLKFCRKFRKATKKAGIRTVVSYRAISRMAKLSLCMDVKNLLDSCLIKSLEIDDLNAIRDKVAGCGKYSEAFIQIADSKK